MKQKVVVQSAKFWVNRKGQKVLILNMLLSSGPDSMFINTAYGPNREMLSGLVSEVGGGNEDEICSRLWGAIIECEIAENERGYKEMSGAHAVGSVIDRDKLQAALASDGQQAPQQQAPVPENKQGQDDLPF